MPPFTARRQLKGNYHRQERRNAQKIGTLSRKDIEQMLDKKVYLELWVKVKTDWRNNDFLIKISVIMPNSK